MLEAELKIPLPRSVSSPSSVLPADAELVEEVEQVDIYFQHPSRDFARTDEALRIRRQANCCWLTYKGPRQQGQVKAREELEVSVSCATAMQQIMTRVGFTPAATVRKKRQVYRWRQLLLCLDKVEGLGWFIEIEATESLVQTDGWQDSLWQAARALGLDPRTALVDSYLELLMKKKGQSRDGA